MLDILEATQPFRFRRQSLSLSADEAGVKELLAAAEAAAQAGRENEAMALYYEAFTAMRGVSPPTASAEQLSIQEQQATLAQQFNQHWLADDYESARTVAQAIVQLDPTSSFGMQAVQDIKDIDSLLETLRTIGTPTITERLTQPSPSPSEIMSGYTSREIVPTQLPSGFVPDVTGVLGNVDLSRSANAGMGIPQMPPKPLVSTGEGTNQIRKAHIQEIRGDIAGAASTLEAVASDPKASPEARTYAQRRLRELDTLQRTITELRERRGGNE